MALPEAERRVALVWRMEVVAFTGDRRRADRLLVEATRWLRAHPRDAVILEARNELRHAFPPDPGDTGLR